MRELKFRAWDKQTLQMSPEFVLFGEFTLLGAVHAWQHDCGNQSNTSLEALDDLEIMQYTGLKDKNGVEIFEGDICLKYWQQDLYADREPMIGVIKWVDFGGRFTHECNGLYGHKYYHELHENFTHEDYPKSMFEVVGNIYQHKHLLK